MLRISDAQYPALLEIINETYTDRLERILVAEMDDDGTIKVIGQDGQKQIGVILSEDAIQIKELKRGTTTINFASPKKCIKGLSCGGTCISRGSLCRKALTPKQAAKVAELKKRIGKGDAKAKGQLDAFKKDRVDKYDGAIKREVMRMLGITKAQDEAIGPKKDKPKPKPKPAATKPEGESPMDTIRRNNPGMDGADVRTKAEKIGKLDGRGENMSAGDKAYRASLLAKDDPDNNSNHDRVDELYRLRNHVEKRGNLGGYSVGDMANALLQGQRGGSNKDSSLAAAEYAAEIYGKLSAEDKEGFRAAIKGDSYLRGGSLGDRIRKTATGKHVLSSRAVRKFVTAIDN